LKKRTKKLLLLSRILVEVRSSNAQAEAKSSKSFLVLFFKKEQRPPTSAVGRISYPPRKTDAQEQSKINRDTRLVRQAKHYLSTD
jgi:hypothetical protein